MVRGEALLLHLYSLWKKSRIHHQLCWLHDDHNDFVRQLLILSRLNPIRRLRDLPGLSPRSPGPTRSNSLEFQYTHPNPTPVLRNVRAG